ncbi:hypothetical protein N7494_008012 [Penicillium frequentans]|uniref:Uncharacterized protein n=1 Tax=Penicillium frequentans TaxID=3151616 RepID=A0AAD6CTU3_9EURO|nr:hypothetical protein N7494_008012 [Penicillium glabrum]
MEGLLSNDNDPEEVMAPTQLQRNFLSKITSVLRRPKSHNIKKLEIYLRNPSLDINFELLGISPLSKATAEWIVLERLLQHEAIDLNFCNSDGRTSLFFAVKYPQTDSLRLLIDKGALIDQKDNEGRTPLSLAAELGRLDHVKILVESNADINSADGKGWTPLHWAFSMCNHETVEYLSSNQDVNNDHQDVNGRTHLVIAAEAGNGEMIRYLLGAKAAKQKRMIGIERNLLIWAIFQQDVATVQILLKTDESLINHRVKGRTPLSMATEIGDPEIAELLVSARADVHALDEAKWPPLSEWLFKTYLPPDEILLQVEHYSANNHPTKQPMLLLAAELGRVEILKLLLNANANVNSVDAKRRTALAWAAEKGHDMAVETLLNIPGICVDSRDVTGQTPLMIAARLDRINIINQLLISNAAINSEDEQKWTPLSWAVANGRVRAVELLLRALGSLVGHQDGQGRTPFSLAAERGFIQIMHLLIENGADPHVPDNEGHTGFWWFLRARHDLFIHSPNQLIRPRHGGIVNPLILQTLIWALPTPNKKDRSGRNWLSWAAEYGDDEVVEYFLQVEDKADKVDINICDGTEDLFSRTPLIWALESGNKTLIDLLKDCDTISLHLLVEGISSIEQENVLRLVWILLQAKYNLNQTDQKGRTPLHLACIKGSLELVSALIKSGADISSTDHTGETPLQCALKVQSKAQSKALVDLLLKASLTDLKPVQSHEWFTMGNKKTLWVQITRSQSDGHELELIDHEVCDWLPRAKEARLCIREKSSKWSGLPQMLDVHDRLHKMSTYWSSAQKDHGHRSTNYISLAFPGELSWGIAWIRRRTAEGFAHGFISMLSSGWVPETSSDFFELFLMDLQQRWKASCTNANGRVELLRHDQIKERGRSHAFIDELAKNALGRADLRQCLKSHIEGLNRLVDTNFSFEPDPQIRALIDKIEQEVTANLDTMEQAVRDLLQIELAWISTNEAASFKRLSWITFIFLPLMFVSSLFGMNVNLLQDNPDWRWYILFGGLTLVFTAALWLITKCIPQAVRSIAAGKLGVLLREGRNKRSSNSSV